VLIAARNAAGTIARAVASALAQPEAAEVIVVDDGSGDDTAARARACDDGSGRLIVVSQQNRGPAAARNRAIGLSKAPLLCALDADDHFLPGRLGLVLERAGSDWDLVADELLVAKGDACAPSGLTSRGGRIGFAEFVRGNVSDPKRPRCELGFLKPVMSRAFLNRHGLRYDQSLRLGEDYALYAEALALGARFQIVEACGYVAVVRPGSLSHIHTIEDLRALIAADERLARLPNLTRWDLEAVGLHRECLRLKLNHRRARRAQAEGRLAEALGLVFQDLATARYILGRTFEAKREALSAAFSVARAPSWTTADMTPPPHHADAA
jgi:succinoglycan biosynthesis protein ExoU